MRHFSKLICGAATLSVLLTSCIDDNYDLSDIDTTSEFKVDNLALPINLDPVVLSDIIKIKEGDELKEVTIGDNTFYAIQRSGEFNSDGIYVNKFEADAAKMNDHTATFRLINPSSAHGKRNATGFELMYLISPVRENLEYDATNIDGSLRDLTAIYFDDTVLKLTVSTNGLSSGIQSRLTDVQLTVPKGLSIKNVKAGGENYGPDAYDPDSGTLTLIEGFDLTNNQASIEITADGVNLSDYNGTFTYNPNTDSGSFKLQSVFNIESANLRLTGDAGALASIQEVNFNVQYMLGSLKVNAILGRIEYDLSGTGLYIDPINLGDMPTFLEDPETDLRLSNPQVYLQLKNPIGQYGLMYQSSLNILVQRDGQPDKSFPSPLVQVPPTTGMYNFVLAPYPDKISSIPSEFAYGLEKLTYNDLGNILSGNGLPNSLDIQLVNPMIPVQPLKSPFRLGTSIEGMEGSYMFLAPLSLAEGSKIVKVVDGWWSEDLSDLNIDLLSISTNVTNEVSTSVILHVYAIDRDGNQISTEGSLVLSENAVNEPIEIKLTGLDGKPFNNLDGVKIYVMAGENEGQPLAPSQSITLDNIKARVTGNYIRKL